MAGPLTFDTQWTWPLERFTTYRANSKEPEKTKCFLGSVNDSLALAMRGSKASIIALPGGVNLISAGSPCPGFSNMQKDRDSRDSLRNASMVASVVSFVDVYCPEYCIIENVIIAAFVAMGYQAQQFLMDAWSYGSSQHRSRIIIVASAPGLEPLQLPHITHDHLEADDRQHALGKSSNGRKFGVRRSHYTPFPYMTAKQATADLPDIADGQCRICPSHPDHYPPSEEGAKSRERIACVPIRPMGMGLADAVRQGLVGEPAEFFRGSSSTKGGFVNRSYRRVHPDLLFPTFKTSLILQCGRTGETLHWDQDRSLTVMDLRRAVGFLDREVIIGTPQQQAYIIGNSVDRKVSFVLGLGLRESWSKSTASRLPVLQLKQNTQLATPSHSEEDETNKARGSRHVSTNVFRDMLRAGASALASLETPERIALQAVEMTGPQRQTSATVIDLTGSDSEDEENEILGGSVDTRFANRPVAYVEIQRL